jgi:uncharacterized protein (TIGR02246 family)
MSKRSLWFLFFLITGGGQAFAADDVRLIAESNIAKWNEALAKGKVEDILSLYTDNAMLVQPNGAVSTSKGEIRAFWQTMIDKKSGALTVDIMDARGEHEDTIVTKTTLSDVKTLQDPQRVKQLMKYSYDGVLYSVLKRQNDGTWKAQVQRWSERNKS